MIDEDIDGDGKIAPWEKLCFWLIAGCVGVVLGKELI